MDVLLQRAGLGHDPERPFVDSLAFRGQALIARAPPHEGGAQLLFQRPDTEGQGWLGDAEHLGGPPEMALAHESDEHFEPVLHETASPSRRTADQP